MFDLPGDADIAAIATQVYEKGGILSAVCHGTVGASRFVSVFFCLSAMALLVRHVLSGCLSVCLPWHCWCVTFCQGVCLSVCHGTVVASRSVRVFVCLSAMALLVRHVLSGCLSVCLPWHCWCVTFCQYVCLSWHYWCDTLCMFAMAIVGASRSVSMSVCHGTIGASRSVCLPWHCWCVTFCQYVCLSWHYWCVTL